ncbi:hypothetical protein LJC08_04250 [Methanimicrococcus sp. OttesenSCG-928-J09]|nr:hypothetical protein [Methanimicrococcus sp. OttesenSCG-928-J09]
MSINDDDILEYIEFPYENDIEYDLSKFKLHILYHPNVPQEEVADVFYNSKRVGWIFPISRLESNESFLENEAAEKYLIKHMEIAAKKLGLQYKTKIEERLSSDADQIKLSSIVGDDAVLFVESSETSQRIGFEFLNVRLFFLLQYHL